MAKSDLTLLPTATDGVFELRVQLDLNAAPLAQHGAGLAAELATTRQVLVEMQARVCELEAHVEMLSLTQPQPLPASAAVATSRQAEPAPPPVYAMPPPPAAPRPAAAEPTLLEQEHVLAWAEAQFLQSFDAAPAACAAVELPAAPPVRLSRPRPSPAPRAAAAVTPVTAVAKRITDTLSDFDKQLGGGRSLVDRLLSCFGIWRASEWDDVDALRDSSTFPAIVPWYRRSGLLLVFIAAAFVVFLAVGGVDWVKGQLAPRSTPVPTPAAIELAEPAPRAAATSVNLLAGTPFERPATAGDRRP